MSDAHEPPPEPAESRAIELMRLVGTRTPTISSHFNADLVARARAQRSIAGPLRALGGLLAAIATAVAAAARGSSGERRR
jgi:hypothetical protein